MTEHRKTHPTMILIACTLAFVIISLDITVVNVALDRIRSALDTSVTGLQWVVNAYTLAFASLLLTTGSLGDRFGQKPMMTAGLLLFTAASIGCGLAGSIETLIAARVLQGVAAALCVPSSLALINITFSDRKARAKAIGIWAGTASLALGAGPIIGGLLVDYLGWPSIFLINIPFGLAGIWLTLVHAPTPQKQTARSLDVAGQVLGILLLAGLALGFVESGQYGWSHPIVLSGFAAFVIFGACFLGVEARSREPMMPLALFRSASITTTSLIGMLLNFGYYGVMFAISFYFQTAKGYSPLMAGLSFLPMTAVLSIVNFSSGPLNARFGARPPIYTGLALSAIGYLSLTGLGQETPYALVMVALMAIGIGTALTVPAISVVLMDGTEPTKAGIASGVFNTARQIGGVVGVGVFGSLLAGNGQDLVPGIRLAFGLSGSAMILALITAIIGLGLRGRRLAVSESSL